MTDEEKKRYRPFRGIAWVGYLILSVGFSVLIIVSVFSSAIAMSPSRPATGQLRTLSECTESTAALYTELHATYVGLSQSDVIENADYRFLVFRNDWIARKRALEAECDIDAPG